MNPLNPRPGDVYQFGARTVTMLDVFDVSGLVMVIYSTRRGARHHFAGETLTHWRRAVRRWQKRNVAKHG